MLKKLKAAPTVDVSWQGEVVATVRGLSPADVSAILVSVGEDLAALFSVVEDVEGIKISLDDKETLAEKLMTEWPKIIVSVSEHLPNVIAQLIARAADSPDDWEMVKEHYSFVLQFDILAEIAKLTFNEPAGFQRFVGNVLMLVDLSGTLTSGSVKRPRTRGVQPSSAVG